MNHGGGMWLKSNKICLWLTVVLYEIGENSISDKKLSSITKVQ